MEIIYNKEVSTERKIGGHWHFVIMAIRDGEDYILAVSPQDRVNSASVVKRYENFQSMYLNNTAILDEIILGESLRSEVEAGFEREIFESRKNMLLSMYSGWSRIEVGNGEQVFAFKYYDEILSYAMDELGDEIMPVRGDGWFGPVKPKYVLLNSIVFRCEDGKIKSAEVNCDIRAEFPDAQPGGEMAHFERVVHIDVKKKGRMKNILKSMRKAASSLLGSADKKDSEFCFEMSFLNSGEEESKKKDGDLEWLDYCTRVNLSGDEVSMARFLIELE